MLTAHRMEVAGTKCQPNNTLHQRWGAGKQWGKNSKKKVMHFNDSLLYVYLEFFPALLSGKRTESHFWDVKLKCY